MKDSYRILASDRERMIREGRKPRIIAVTAGLLSLALFSYPVLREYRPKWQALRASRKLAVYLEGLRTRAILAQAPREARFVPPDRIEEYEVSSCGPHPKVEKRGEQTLGQFASGVVFAPEAWVRANLDARAAVLSRYCYDPMFGSSLHADGLAHGSIVLAMVETLQRKSESPDDDALQDLVAKVGVSGPSGELELE